MVSNADVIRTLERIADLLEIRGENTFKVRAYRLAAMQVENLGRSLHDIAAAQGDLRSVDGFGAAIADKMGELIATGRSSYLESLEAEVPPTLVDILALPGMGPRTVATLWHEGGITTLGELEAAARRGALDGLPRLRARTAERILAALDAAPAAVARRLGAVTAPRWPPSPSPSRNTIAGHPAVERVEIAGSFRRDRESCGDLRPAGRHPRRAGGAHRVRRPPAGGACPRARGHQELDPRRRRLPGRLPRGGARSPSVRRCSISRARRLTTSAFAVAPCAWA